MQKQENDIVFITKIRNFFKRPKTITKGQFGIYHYMWACDTMNEDSNGLKYDIYAKLKAVEIYEGLVEVEIMNIKINDSASQDIINIITKNFPKYVNPKYVKWQIQ